MFETMHKINQLKCHDTVRASCVLRKRFHGISKEISAYYKQHYVSDHQDHGIIVLQLMLS